jgi:hypothetical protein
VSDEDTGQEETSQKNDDTSQKNSDEGGGDKDDVERYESGQIAEKPEPTDEQKQDAKEMRKSYIEERPTTVLPGSDNTVTGTAVNDWIDDDGNPVHGDIEDDRQEAAERDREINKRAEEGQKEKMEGGKASDDEDDDAAAEEKSETNASDEDEAEDDEKAKEKAKSDA